MNFSTTSPNQNDVDNAGVVHTRASRPAVGTSAESKIILALSKNQYQKLSKSESTLKDDTCLDQARGIDDNIRHYAMVLEKYDILQVFEIVYPKDPALKRVTLKVKNGSLLIKSLLKNFCTITIKEVA